MTRTTIAAIAAGAVAAQCAFVWLWTRRPIGMRVDDDEWGYELVRYEGDSTLVMSPAVDGMPRVIQHGDVLLVRQELAADLVELPSGRWAYVEQL